MWQLKLESSGSTAALSGPLSVSAVAASAGLASVGVVMASATIWARLDGIEPPTLGFEGT